jgi:hypothetical protein
MSLTVFGEDLLINSTSALLMMLPSRLPAACLTCRHCDVKRQTTTIGQDVLFARLVSIFVLAFGNARQNM